MTESNCHSAGPNPIISHNQLAEILELLLCHGLHNNLDRLLCKLGNTFPEMVPGQTSSPNLQLAVFSGFFSKFLQVGPLPDICHWDFLNLLHDGIIGMVRHNSQVFLPTMSIHDIIKLVSGVRVMLGKTMILEEKFVVKDIEIFIVNNFPILPVVGENRKAWESLGEIFKFDVGQVNNNTMQIISKVNANSAKHMNEKLKNLVLERARSISDQENSFLCIWRKGKLEEKLKTFMAQIDFFLNRNILEVMTVNNNVKLKLLTRGLSKKPSEEELIGFVNHLQNVFIESEFWSNDLVQKALA